MSQYVVKLGRTDGTAIKTLFFGRRREAIVVANSVGFMFWGHHAFKRSECRDRVSHEEGDFSIQFIAEHDPQFDNQGAQRELSFDPLH